MRREAPLYCVDEEGPEFGTEQTVLEVLAKKRELYVGEIRALANRFRVSPAVFI